MRLLPTALAAVGLGNSVSGSEGHLLAGRASVSALVGWPLSSKSFALEARQEFREPERGGPVGVPFAG